MRSGSISVSRVLLISSTASSSFAPGDLASMRSAVWPDSTLSFSLSWSNVGVISSGTSSLLTLLSSVSSCRIFSSDMWSFLVLRLSASAHSLLEWTISARASWRPLQHSWIANTQPFLVERGYEVTGKVYGILTGTLDTMAVGAIVQYTFYKGSFVPSETRINKIDIAQLICPWLCVQASSKAVVVIKKCNRKQ